MKKLLFFFLILVPISLAFNTTINIGGETYSITIQENAFNTSVGTNQVTIFNGDLIGNLTFEKDGETYSLYIGVLNDELKMGTIEEEEEEQPSGGGGEITTRIKIGDIKTEIPNKWFKGNTISFVIEIYDTYGDLIDKEPEYIYLRFYPNNIYFTSKEFKKVDDGLYFAKYLVEDMAKNGDYQLEITAIAYNEYSERFNFTIADETIIDIIKKSTDEDVIEEEREKKGISVYEWIFYGLVVILVAVVLFGLIITSWIIAIKRKQKKRGHK